MKEKDSLSELMGELPMELQLRMKMSMAIAARIEQLMVAAGYTKKQFAEELGRRPSEVTKWLSGQHNFTVATLAKLAAFFDQPIIKVVSDDGQLQEG